MDHPDSPSPAGRDSEPGNPEQLRARAIARGRREAMNRRARRIRRTVAGATAALFAAAFLGIYVQLAAGHDPALDAKAKRTSAATVTAAGNTSATKAAESEAESASGSSAREEAESSSSASEEESSSSSTESESSSVGGPSSLTTSQS